MFDFLKKTPPAATHPAQAEPIPGIRDTLFGDEPLAKWARPGMRTDSVQPWISFAEASSELTAGRREAALSRLESILAMPGLESRHYLQAWAALREAGHAPPAEQGKQLLGVVVEVALPGGLDLLAAYADGSARYWNYSGAGVVWDAPDDRMRPRIDQLFAVSRAVVDAIGPWEGPRPAAPTGDRVRLNFLTPGGLNFGEGPMGTFSRDLLAGPVISSAIELMHLLMAVKPPPPAQA